MDTGMPFNGLQDKWAVEARPGETAAREVNRWEPCVLRAKDTMGFEGSH